MRIAQIAPLYEAVPPKLYGGTERIVGYLADALVDLGQDVTLFASGDTETKARLVPCRDQALRLDPNPLTSDIAAHLSKLDRLTPHDCLDHLAGDGAARMPRPGTPVQASPLVKLVDQYDRGRRPLHPGQLTEGL